MPDWDLRPCDDAEDSRRLEWRLASLSPTAGKVFAMVVPARQSAALISTVCLGVTTLMAAPASAGPGDGAVVTRNLGCGMLDADGTLFDDPLARRLVVVKPDGTESVRCHGRVPDGFAIPDQAVVLRGFECFGGGRTQNIIAPSGRVTLTCGL